MFLNTPLDIILFVIEILGCVAFATAGAFKAIRKRADILGVIILTLIEVFGGGLLRDLIISQGVPHLFWDPEYLVFLGVSTTVTIIWFMVAYFRKSAPFIEKHRHDFWIYALDAVGIAVFCVAGVRVAYASLESFAITNVIGKYFYLIFLGVTTGVGGGMFRDIFVNEIPMVFKKHFYMTPCILGTTAFAIMYDLLPSKFLILSVSVSLLIIIGLRIIATIFKWNLPYAKGYNDSTDELSRGQNK